MLSPNFIICHGFVHRLRNDGLMESTPIRSNPQNGTLIIDKKEDLSWMVRTPESMDLSGGDIDFIQTELKRFRDVFSFAEKRLPVTQETFEQIRPAANEPV